MCTKTDCAVAKGETCRTCAVLPVQCNHCRANHQNRATQTAFALTALMRANPGMTPAEAERAMGVLPGPVVGG